MSGMRREYFKDVLGDVLAVIEELDIEPEDRGAAILALVLSDSLNGIRKAMLTPQYVLTRTNMPQQP